MAWFKRKSENIKTDEPKKGVTDGSWIKCDKCGELMHKKQWESNFYTCNNGSQIFIPVLNVGSILKSAVMNI